MLVLLLMLMLMLRVVNGRQIVANFRFADAWTARDELVRLRVLRWVWLTRRNDERLVVARGGMKWERSGCGLRLCGWMDGWIDFNAKQSTRN